MLLSLKDTEINELQKKYYYLINYDSNDPINPLSYVDSNGDSLLHIAAQHGDLQTIKILLNAGVDVNIKGDMGCTALHYAKMENNEEVVRLLIAYGADVSIKNEFGKLPDDMKK